MSPVTTVNPASVPGLNMPTQTAMLAGNPRDSAIASQAASAAKLTALNNAVSGGRRGRRKPLRNSRHKRCLCHCRCSSCKHCVYKSRKYRTRGGSAVGDTCSWSGCGGRRRRTRRRGGAAAATATVAVPQFTMMYSPTGAAGQTPNDIIKQNSQISTQSAANAAYDNYASQKGGYVWRGRR